ncbi:hypothetical protein QAD02_022344 [Eretmocerus hayati]|uniref:Uncharacterized protein n=1 Tax=Eretmocerus hayati TaxID=131215 RepID=A0ACC2PXL9_9HYME|nr:hypothetical protein QAD02_022344 [Eretmocerus hayati]
MAQSYIADVPAESISSFVKFVLKAPASPEYRHKKLFVGRGVPFDDEELSRQLIQEGLLDNSKLIRCFRIIAIPHYREKGLYLISKELVDDISDNRELLARLSQPDDPKIATMTDAEIINYLPTCSGERLYCFGINPADMSFVGLLDREEIMKTSQIHPNTNPDVGVMEGINTSLLYLAGVNAFSEIHLENAHLPSMNVGIKRFRENPIIRSPTITNLIGRGIKVWLMLPEREPLERAIHMIQEQDKAEASGTKSPTCSSDADVSSPEENPVVSPSIVKHTSPVTTTRSKRKRAGTAKTRGAKKRKSKAKTNKSHVEETSSDPVGTFSFANSCPTALSHKYVYADTIFLDRHGIAYETTRQNPHDIVYTTAGTYHEVGQLGANIAEAQNFADPLFNIYAEHVTVDLCDQSKLTTIKPNRHQITTVKSRPQILHDCEDCTLSTTCKETLRIHRRDIHGKDEPRILNRIPKMCMICKVVVKKLADHEKNSKAHAAAVLKLQESGNKVDEPISVWRCQFCHTDFADDDAKKKHELDCAANRPSSSAFRGSVELSVDPLTQCPFCERFYRSFEFHQHQKFCDSKKFKCDVCQRTYKKNYDLKHHKSRCHPST